MSKEESIRSVICGNLNRLLHQRRMTQKELSEYMGVSASTVNDWVRGKKIPRMDKVDKLCSIFGVSREEILYDNSSRTNPASAPAPPAPQKSGQKNRRRGFLPAAFCNLFCNLFATYCNLLQPPQPYAAAVCVCTV